MTSHSTSSSHHGVPKAISDFIANFYRIADIEEEHEEFVRQFSKDENRLSFQIGPMEKTSHPAGVLKWRHDAWANTKSRHHDIYAVFVHPQREEVVMIEGTVKRETKDGKSVSYHWVGRMQFAQESLKEGRPTIEAYKVWLVDGKL